KCQQQTFCQTLYLPIMRLLATRLDPAPLRCSRQKLGPRIFLTSHKLAKDYCKQRCRYRNPSQFDPARVTGYDREDGSDSCYEEGQSRKRARCENERSNHLYSFGSLGGEA